MQHRMKKYYLQGKEISEKQAKAIEAKNRFHKTMIFAAFHRITFVV